MSSVVLHLRGWRPRWHTTLVLLGALVVVVSLALSFVAPMMLTTVAALVGGTAFVLGVSAGISAFFERDGNGDSDFWR